jgi:molybdate transport system substrate-binding protein
MRLIRCLFTLLGVGVALLAACAPPPAARQLTIFAAASLRAPFEQIGAEFAAARPGVEVRFNFAGSQQLAQQIIEGAPADVFASANARQMQALIQAGAARPGTAQPFVLNRLVVITPLDNPAGITGLEGLAAPGVRLVLAAAEVPAGEYALEFLDRASATGFGPGYRQAVLENVVSYEENVKAVLGKVVLGEADAGIVYVSDAAGVAGLGAIEIPAELNVTSVYPIQALSGSSQAELAEEFIAYVLSPAGQAALAKDGFTPVSASR